MALPDAHHVARTCKYSTLDPDTQAPTPASFEFRLGDGDWETYLSVNWIEMLAVPNTSLSDKLATLRSFLLSPPAGIPVLKPTKSMVFAVLPVAAIHSAASGLVGTTLSCRHSPNGEGDPHSGVFPNPGTECWPRNKDAPAHLAVKQHLLMSVCHREPAVPS